MKPYLKLALPHLVAVATFVAFSLIFFSPLVQGYSLKQSDVRQYQGMSKEILDHHVVHGEDPLWTNSMFGGMPAYQILVYDKSNMLSYVDRMIKLGLPKPAAILFTILIGFYIFALCLRVNPWLGIGAALAYGFCTIHILYLGAGHITKVNTIAYMAPTLGGLILAFRGRALLGGALFSLFFGLNLMANHPQMTYYLGFLCLFIGVGELVRLISIKKTSNILYPSGILILGALIALVSNASSLMPTQEYSAYTTRGATELTIEANGTPKEQAKKTGLNTSYILEYNYGGGELLSMLIPKARGEMGAPFGNDEDVMRHMSERDFENNTDFASDQTFRSQSTYWGGQRFSGGAFYFGVVLFVLFVFGIVFLKDVIKWPILLLSVLAMLLASNDPGGINDYFINHFPLYNKFRDSKMILVLIQLMIPMVALLFIDALLKNKFSFSNPTKLYITGGILLFFFGVMALIPSLSGDFISDNESKLFSDAVKNQPDAQDYFIGLKSAMKDARAFLFKKDAARAFGLCFLTLLFLFYFSRKKSSAVFVGIGLFILAFGDNYAVSKRYLNTSVNEENSGLDKMTTLESQGFLNEDEDRISYNSFEPNALALLPPEMPRVSDEFILAGEILNIDSYDLKLNDFLAGLEDHFYYHSIQNEKVKNLIAQYGVLNQNTNYRVFTLGNPFNETVTSYYHKSIGGYHGAKLKRYQELIDFRIAKESQFVQQNINRLGLSVFKETPTLNMLNTKYVVLNPQQRPVQNNYALGNAWFVADIQIMDDADAEIRALSDSTVDVAKTAVVHKSFQGVQTIKNRDLGAKIEMVQYAANLIEYAATSQSAQNAIFSEIYYPEGWHCYINGKLVNDYRANYILRGVVVPAGKSKIEWKFEPQTFYTYKSASLFGSLFLILGFLIVTARSLKPVLNHQNPEVK